MDFYLKYQQRDTVQTKKLLDLGSNAKPREIVNVKRTVLTKESFIIDTTSRSNKEIEKSTPVPVAGVRYFNKKNEESLLVNNSKYIKLRDSFELMPQSVEVEGVILPERSHVQTNYDWITIILFFSLALYATVRIPYAKYIEHLFQSLINYSTATRMFRERNYSIMHGAFRLDIYFYLIFSLFAYQVLKHFNVALLYDNFNLFLICAAAIISYFFLKRVVFLIIGFINKGLTETNEYWFNLNNYNRGLGIFLFPIVTIIAFLPTSKPVIFVVLGLIFVIFFYCKSLQRGISLMFNKQFSFFYLFLYLCTLEILPLLLIYKMVLA